MAPRKGQTHEPRHEALCVMCGRPFLTKYAGRGLFCSRPCSSEARVWRKILAGRGHKGYGSIADRLGSQTIEGSALDRLVRAAVAVQEAKRRAFEELPAGQQVRLAALREGFARSIRRRGHGPHTIDRPG